MHVQLENIGSVITPEMDEFKINSEEGEECSSLKTSAYLWLFISASICINVYNGVVYENSNFANFPACRGFPIKESGSAFCAHPADVGHKEYVCNEGRIWIDNRNSGAEWNFPTLCTQLFFQTFAANENSFRSKVWKHVILFKRTQLES